MSDCNHTIDGGHGHHCKVCGKWVDELGNVTGYTHEPKYPSRAEIATRLGISPMLAHRVTLSWDSVDSKGQTLTGVTWETGAGTIVFGIVIGLANGTFAIYEQREA